MLEFGAAIAFTVSDANGGGSHIEMSVLVVGALGGASYTLNWEQGSGGSGKCGSMLSKALSPLLGSMGVGGIGKKQSEMYQASGENSIGLLDVSGFVDQVG